MTFVADTDLTDTLKQLDGVAKILDADGRCLGYFSPLAPEEAEDPQPVNGCELTKSDMRRLHEQWQREKSNSPSPVESAVS